MGNKGKGFVKWPMRSRLKFKSMRPQRENQLELIDFLALSFAWFLTGSLFILALVVTSGCARKAEKETTDPVVRSLKLIEEKNYNEAISLLLAQPQDDQIRQLLASTYAARAGLFIEDLWEIVKTYKTPVPQEPLGNSLWLQDTIQQEKMQKVIQQVSGSGFKVEAENLKTISLHMAEFSQVVAAISVIPVLKPTQWQDIERARDVLALAAAPGAKLYRSFLTLASLRSSFEFVFLDWKKSLSLLLELSAGTPSFHEQYERVCAVQIQGFFQWSKKASEDLIELGQDLTLAYPSRKAELLEAQQWLLPLTTVQTPMGVCP